MICIIDYGLGNIRSLVKAFDKIGVNSVVSNKLEQIEAAEALVLPGVGSFEKGMNNLVSLDLVPVLRHEVLTKKKPILGICLGAQLLFEGSEEGNPIPGLGLVKGQVRKFSLPNLKIPHVGWNDVFGDFKTIDIFEGIESVPSFYFVHSFHFAPGEPIAFLSSKYGIEFVSVIQKENIWGTQFHPEKSQAKGLQILKNFATRQNPKGG